jgi:hypothetical protein
VAFYILLVWAGNPAVPRRHGKSEVFLMKVNTLFFAGAALVLMTTFVLAACGSDPSGDFSIKISGTPRIGATLTATVADYPFEGRYDGDQTYWFISDTKNTDYTPDLDLLESNKSSFTIPATYEGGISIVEKFIVVIYNPYGLYNSYELYETYPPVWSNWIGPIKAAN